GGLAIASVWDRWRAGDALAQPTVVAAEIWAKGCMRNHSKTEKEKKLADDARLMKWWKAWHREQRDEALAKHPSLTELFRMFANIQHVAPMQLVGFVQSINWADVDYA